MEVPKEKTLTLELDRCLKMGGKKTKLEKNIAKRQNSTRQEKPDDGQTNNFIDFLDQIKEGQNNIDMKLFKIYLTSKTPAEMVWALYNSKSKIENYSILSPIINKFDYFPKKTDEMPKDG